MSKISHSTDVNDSDVVEIGGTTTITNFYFGIASMCQKRVKVIESPSYYSTNFITTKFLALLSQDDEEEEQDAARQGRETEGPI